MGTTTPAVGATPAVTLLVRCGGLFRFGRVASARPFAHALQLRAEELTDLTREEIKHDWSVDEVMALFEAPLNDLLFQAQSIHRRYHTPNEVQISTLFSIKTGGCPEDCKFCPQSIHYDTGLDLHNLLGVETALTVAAEVGADLSRFATAAHFCSWLGLAPGTRISGDKRLGGPSARQTNRVGQALRMAASTARNSKTTIGAAHRRRLSRMDSAKAVKATAHQLGRLMYAMLTRGEEYVERDLAAMETERRDRQIKHLQRQARHFDLALVPAEQAA